MFDHGEMFSLAVRRLRGKLDYSGIAFALSPKRFTLRALQDICEAILDTKLNKPALPRRMLDRGWLEATGERETDASFCPAELYCSRQAEGTMMAKVGSFGFAAHLRAGASSHVIRCRKGRVRQSGRGLVFWLRPETASIAELPMDDRETALFVKGRNQDFQTVAVQGTMTRCVADPELLAARVDFTIGLGSGGWTAEPIQRLGRDRTLAESAKLPDGAPRMLIGPRETAGFALIKAKVGLTPIFYSFSRDTLIGAVGDAPMPHGMSARGF